MDKEAIERKKVNPSLKIFQLKKLTGMEQKLVRDHAWSIIMKPILGQRITYVHGISTKVMRHSYQEN